MDHIANIWCEHHWRQNIVSNGNGSDVQLFGGVAMLTPVNKSVAGF
jgi:hypothetical protein